MSRELRVVALSGASRIVRIDPVALASGGEGAIHRIEGAPALIAKVYHEPGKDPQRLKKLQAMLADPPELPAIETNGKRYIQIAWPAAWLEEADGRLAGFVMPVVDLLRATALENFLAKKTRARAGLPESYGFRLAAAANLAAVVAELHAHGHHIIDLKPINLNVYVDTFYMAVLDCDGFSVKGKDGERFPAHQYSDGYVCPEALQKSLPPQALGEEQDRFALAVILFQLLNQGLHPYQGTPAAGAAVPPTNEERIRQGLYAYGRRDNPLLRPSPWSIHAYFDDETRALFDRAFSGGDRPSALEWHRHLRPYTDFESGKVCVCAQDREHVHFSGECPWCALENKASVRSTSKHVLRVVEAVKKNVFTSPAPRWSTSASIPGWTKVHTFVAAAMCLIWGYALVTSRVDVRQPSSLAPSAAARSAAPSVAACRAEAPPTPQLGIDIAPKPAGLGSQPTVKEVRFSWPAVRCATHYQLTFTSQDASARSPLLERIEATSATINIDANSADRLNASYRLSACNDAGCTESEPHIPPHETLLPAGSIEREPVTPWREFGAVVAMSDDGNVLAVRASDPGVFDRAQTVHENHGGFVFVYTRNGGSWDRHERVSPPVLNANGFGVAIALSSDGSTLAVGAPGEDDTGHKTGRVYIFTRSGNTWRKQAEVKASNPGVYDDFGEALAISDDGNTLAVGAHGEDGGRVGTQGKDENSVKDAGAVYVFTRRDGAWRQQAYVKASNAGAGDAFGDAVALSGDGETLVVGAPLKASQANGINGDQADDSRPRAGAVYVFARSGDAWAQRAYVKASDPKPNADFGATLALSNDGGTLAVGTSWDLGVAWATNKTGAVYLFTRSDDWDQQAVLKAPINGEADNDFGRAIALSGDGNTLVVGAPGDSLAHIDGGKVYEGAANAGTSYVFMRAQGIWEHKYHVKPPEWHLRDAFGAALALSGEGKLLAVGSPGKDVDGRERDNAGDVYLY